MKLGLALLVSAVCCLAQQPYEIRGSVSEPNVGPLSGIEVRITELTNQQFPSYNSLSVATTYTDARGEYVVRLDKAWNYGVEILSPGYVYDSDPHMVVRVDPEHPRAQANASLVRLGQILGRVLDAETLQPIPGITLRAMRRTGTSPSTYRWLTVPQTLPFDEAGPGSGTMRETPKSSEDGTFTLRDRMPGDYSVTTITEPILTGAGTLIEPFLLGATVEDLNVREQSYRPLFWPGGVPASDAVPLTLTSGGSLNVGNILLKKEPVYRALISVPRGDCPEGESVRLTLFTKGDSKTQVVPCGSELLLKGLYPGNYQLYAVSDWQGERDFVENAVWARASFQVRDKNPMVILNLRRGTVLEVHLTAAQGGPKVPESVKLLFQPDPLGPDLPLPSYEQFQDSAENGRFHVAVGPGPQRVSVSGLRDAYVSEIRYNGASFKDAKIAFNASMPNQSLELVLGNQFATLRGEVTGTTDSSTVVFQPDFIPTSVLTIGSDVSIYTTSVTAGTYRSKPLPPGTYRVAAIPTDRVVINGQLFTIPDDAPRVTLRPGANETLNVRLTPASR